MALAYASTQTQIANSTSVVVTKPTSLAVGDLMMAQLVIHANGRTITLPSGFTQLDLRSEASTGHDSQISYKIADAGDVAAANFTFTISGIGVYLLGAISRFTDPDPSPIVDSDGQANSSASTTCTTPAVDTTQNAFILLYESAVPNPSLTASGQTIATSPPTFTEMYDVAQSSEVQASCAYGLRPETTSTGAGSITLSASRRNIGQIVALKTTFNTSTTAETVTLSEDIDYNVGMTFTESVTATDTLTNTKSRQWTNPDKSTSVWVNQDK